MDFYLPSLFYVYMWYTAIRMSYRFRNNRGNGKTAILKTLKRRLNKTNQTEINLTSKSLAIPAIANQWGSKYQTFE